MQSNIEGLSINTFSSQLTQLNISAVIEIAFLYMTLQHWLKSSVMKKVNC